METLRHHLRTAKGLAKKTLPYGGIILGSLIILVVGVLSSIAFSAMLVVAYPFLTGYALYCFYNREEWKAEREARKEGKSPKKKFSLEQYIHPEEEWKRKHRELYGDDFECE